MLDVDVVLSAEISPVTNPDATALASAVLFAHPVPSFVPWNFTVAEVQPLVICGEVVDDMASSIAFTTL